VGEKEKERKVGGESIIFMLKGGKRGEAALRAVARVSEKNRKKRGITSASSSKERWGRLREQHRKESIEKRGKGKRTSRVWEGGKKKGLGTSVGDEKVGRPRENWEGEKTDHFFFKGGRLDGRGRRAISGVTKTAILGSGGEGKSALAGTLRALPVRENNLERPLS